MKEKCRCPCLLIGKTCLMIYILFFISFSFISGDPHVFTAQLDQKNRMHTPIYIRSQCSHRRINLTYNKAERSSPSNARKDSDFDVVLAIKYSTLPRTLECTLNCLAPTERYSWRPFAAVDV